MTITIKRPDGESIDVAGLAAGGPEEAFLLLSESAQRAVETLPDKARKEVGETIVAFANVVAKIGHQPTVRLDIHMLEGAEMPFLFDLREQGEPLGNARAMTIQGAMFSGLEKLATESIKALPKEHRVGQAKQWSQRAGHAVLFLDNWARKLEAEQ